MNKLVILTTFLAMGSATFEPFSAYRKKIDESDMLNYNKRITCEDAAFWWEAADTLVLKIFNEVLEGQKPIEFFKKFVAEGIEGITVYTREDQSVGLEYHADRPPDNESQEFVIEIHPLDNEASIYFIRYGRNWNELPNCEGRVWRMGTFRIVKKNTPGGKYEIVARQEDTNFYKRIIDSKKIKYVHGMLVPVCEWRPILIEETVKTTNSKIDFEILYVIGTRGSSCQNRMNVSWRYDRTHAPKATENRYRSCDPRYDPNVQLFDQVNYGEPVPFPE